MACLEGATGKRLWDVQIHERSQVSNGLSISGDTVFFASWTALYAVSLESGERRFVIGTEL
jgi:hypothetical protein